MADKVTPIHAQEKLRFGQIIKQHRKQARLTQGDLGEMLSVNMNTVKNWERDLTKPDHGLIPDLCALLGIPLHELYQMQPAGTELSTLESRVVNNLRQMDPANRRAVDKITATLLEEALLQKDEMMKQSFSLFLVRPGTVAAGVGDFVPEDPPTYTFLRKNTTNARADGVVKVHGDSMEPVYHNGDFVYYRAAASARPGEDVVVDTDDGAVIKRMGQDHTLFSVNTALPYPSKSDDNTLVIRGIVLGVVHSSEKPSAEEGSLLEELFSDEIHAFREKYHLDDLA